MWDHEGQWELHGENIIESMPEIYSYEMEVVGNIHDGDKADGVANV
jgi:hypothetical protein